MFSVRQTHFYLSSITAELIQLVQLIQLIQLVQSQPADTLVTFFFA